MYKKILTALMLAAALATTACTNVNPAPDEVAVLIDKPYVFGKGGVREDDVRPGGTLTYTWFSTWKKYVPSRPFAVPVKFDDFSSKDNSLLDFNTTLRLSVTDAPALVRLGDDWMNNSVLPQYTDIVRREVAGYNMQQLMSDQASRDQLDESVTEKVRVLFDEQKLPVTVLGVNLGRAVPNSSVLDEMNRTSSERQRKLTMDEAKLAEDARKEQQAAKAAADNAYRNGLNLSPDEFVKLQLADKLIEACSAAKECVLVPQGTAVVR